MVTLLAEIPGSGRHRKAVYRCICGVEFVAMIENVQRGHTQSCGCFRRQVTQERSLTHGHRINRERTKVYRAWVNMKGRCSNSKRSDYSNYGGRGITYDPHWEVFENFLADMGEPANSKLTLDRIDNSKGYSKENCRWAPRQVQSLNKRNNVLFKFNEQSKTLSEWARETGIGRVTLLKRIQRGVPIDIALTTKGFLKKGA